ncbi:MAG: ABC transporter permease subunit [Lachnospiraceae bacterium]|nr:ABC transporter permease subunit [Lachnospiraceae bacterium]
MFAIYKKELLNYFTSMVGFVFLAVFLAIVGVYFWYTNIGGMSGNFESTLSSVTFLFVILMPILTMKVMADENKQKTDQLLFTSPISITKVIVGKYLAVVSLYAIGVLIISTYPLILFHYSSEIRLATAYSAIIGFFLLGSAYIAIGIFISSMTESQLIAAVVSIIVMLVTFLMPQLTKMLPNDGKSQVIIIAIVWLLCAWVVYSNTKNLIVASVVGVLGEAVIWIGYRVKPEIYNKMLSKGLNGMSMSQRFNDFTLGVLDYSAIVYYVSIAFLFVFLTIQMTKRKRFS